MTPFTSSSCFGNGEAIAPPSEIQPHGALLVLSEPDLTVLQVSRNIDRFLKGTAENLVGRPLNAIAPEAMVERLWEMLLRSSDQAFEVFKFSLPPLDSISEGIASKKGASHSESLDVNVILHRNPDGLLVLELEPTKDGDSVQFSEFYHTIKRGAVQLRQQTDICAMAQLGAEEMRRILAFDRVMVYRFSAEGHGQVIAESKASHLSDTFLNHWFPSEDTQICRRWLPQSNGAARLIADANQGGVPLYPELNPQTKQPINLINAQLRSPHPCHRTYLHNMDRVQASVVVPLMHGDRLWGLLSCHHHQPYHVPYSARQGCEFLGRVISVEISAHSDRHKYEERHRRQHIQTQLLEHMTATESFKDGLLQDSLLGLVQATGVAVFHDNHLASIGTVPSTEHLTALLGWVETHCSDDIYVTDCLSQEYPLAEDFSDIGSGLLVATISNSLKDYILWFRPETLQTVTWAKRPMMTLPVQPETQWLSPPQSFERWRETVCRRSLSWHPTEIDAARELRNATVNIVLRQASEKIKLTDELARSNAELNKFAHITSHDLQEPLNLVANYIQLLELRYKHQLDDDAREFIGYAVDGIDHMQNLIDDLLDYSRVGGQQEQKFEPTPLSRIVDRVLRSLGNRLEQAHAGVAVGSLPTVMGNPTQLTQVFQNLLSNAIKFRGDRPLTIEIHSDRRGDYWEVIVTDNGIGLDPKFSDRIFQIFQRLHTREEYPGTGIGLAICKKIVEHHGGSIYVTSKKNRGAAFHLTLPVLED
ncbi:MAG: ATP-binding protein [Cyanophyceae cyanobacterium]